MKDKFEAFLSNSFDYLSEGRIKEAMSYAILNKAKRVRPLLLLNAINDMGESADDALFIACAIEMIHTYSLIHDDLPAMDNDDYRRGVLTCHKKFDEASAILAGDGLLSEAFAMILKSSYAADIKVKLIQQFTNACGVNGMIRGQELDIYQNELTDLKQTDILKTGCLIALPLSCSAIICQKEEYLVYFKELGELYGLCFQIEDDILDVMGNASELGKAINSDQKNAKKTYVSVYGLKQCEKVLDEYYERINHMFDQTPFQLNGVLQLINASRQRKN